MSAVRRKACLGAFLAVALVACSSDDGPQRVVIPPGSPFRVAADSLASRGVISFPRLFAWYASISGRDRAIKAGTYQFSGSQSWGDIIDALAEGRGLFHTVTIPEGWGLLRIVPQLAKTLEVPEESVAVAVRDTALLRRLDTPTPTLEGYLFPDTYKLAPGTHPSAIVQTMVQNFRKQFGGELAFIATGLDLHDTVTLASIVETEARLEKERPLVASVYLNRTRIKMPLQADPTVVYAMKLKGTWNGNIRKTDLKIQSPYNTYVSRSFPHGPLANPGLASLRAAPAPAKSDSLYFVSRNDGSHVFSRSLAEHNRAVETHQRAYWRQRRAQQQQQKANTAN